MEQHASASLVSEPVIRPYEYPMGPDPCMPEWAGLASFCSGAATSPSSLRGTEVAQHGIEPRRIQADDALLQEARHISFEAGRRAGMEEGRAAAKKEVTEAESAERQQYMRRAATSLNALTEHGDSYLRNVESEVVALALGIAARVLRREAQIDPLLLTGAVRVALGQLSRSTKAELLVPAAELEMWVETLAHLPNLPFRPEVSAGEGMQAGDCALRTEVGSVDLGLRAQLKEIERGFFDSLPAEKPRARSSAASAAGAEKL